MNIKLAGFNVDIDVIKKLKSINKNNKEALKLINTLTPETIAASYARISRDKRNINVLRKDAGKDIEKTRKSNKAIIFTMGHKSIAEHAVFNFDIMKVSRYAVEFIEKSRLASYTEKSQRYITLDGDFITPDEFINAGLDKEYKSLIENYLYKYYFDVIGTLKNYHKKDIKNMDLEALGLPTNEKRLDIILDGWAKEDARYILPMSVEAQLGLTISARNLENLITKLRSSDIIELNKIGEKLFKLTDGIAPSIIKYTKSTEYCTETENAVKNTLKNLINKKIINNKKEVSIFDNINNDNSIIAGIIFSHLNIDFKNALNISKLLSPNKKLEIIKATVLHKEKYDPMIREFELGNRVAELVVSSSCFAQLKRHRMNTLIVSDYDISLKNIIPTSIIKTKLNKRFSDIIKKVNKFYIKSKKILKQDNLLPYILTNSHKRRVLLDANNRQIHAIALERLNIYAQWDIRNVTSQYIREIKKTSPLTLSFLPGKNVYDMSKNKFLKTHIV